MKYQEREKVTERNQMAGKASPANQYFEMHKNTGV